MYLLRQRDAFAWRLGAYQFSPEEYEQHATNVEQQIKALQDQGVDTRSMYGIQHPNGQMRWSPKRKAQQRQVVNDLYNQWSAGVPQQGMGMFMGGLGGSGKGTIQRNPSAALDAHNYMTIDPDKIKEEFARRGMIPKIPGLSPMEASSLVHEESSELANQIAQRAYRNKINVLHDITMSGDKSVGRRLDDMRKHGYGQVDGVFVDADGQTARSRVHDRHRRGEEAFREGQGHGGRWVPHSASKANEPTPGSGKRSKNAEVFERFQPHFDNSVNFDVTGEAPKIQSATGKRWGGMMNQTGNRRSRRMADQAQQPTVKSLLEDWENGHITDFNQLAHGAATALNTHVPNTYSDHGQRWNAAEEPPHENSYAQVECAEANGVLSPGQAEHIATVMDQLQGAKK